MSTLEAKAPLSVDELLAHAMQLPPLQALVDLARLRGQDLDEVIESLAGSQQAQIEEQLFEAFLIQSLEQAEPLKLTQADAIQLVEALDRPGKVHAWLREAAEHYKNLGEAV